MKRLLILLLPLLLACTAALAEDAAALLLQERPDCTLVRGWTADDTAALLVTRSDGARIFLGGVRTEQTWHWTESAPLPEGTGCCKDPGMVSLLLPGGAGAAVQLTEAGWRITSVTTGDRTFTLHDDRVTDGRNVWYGTLPFDRDVTRTDWAAIPAGTEAFVAGLDCTAWRVLTGSPTLLHDAPDGTVTIRCAGNVPVHILAREGEWLQADVIGSGVTGWVRLQDTAEAAAFHTAWNEYIGLYNPGWLPVMEIPAGSPPLILRDAPGGAELMRWQEDDDWLQLEILGQHRGSWYHVTDPYSGMTGFVNALELPLSEPAALAAALLPDLVYEQGLTSPGVGAIFLTYTDAGDCLFVGCTPQADGSWSIVRSVPLPPGAAMDDFHSSVWSAQISCDHPRGETDGEGRVIGMEYVFERTEDGTWHVGTFYNWDDYVFFYPAEDGIYASDHGMCFGSYELETDITRLDWAALPATWDEALALLRDDWAVITVDALPLRAIPAASAASLGAYRFGTPVHILSRREGWAEVTVADSSVTGWLPVQHLAVGRAQITPEGDALTLYTLPGGDTAPGASLHKTPGGSILETDEYGSWLQLLSDAGDGWYHVCWPETAESFYVHESEFTPD